MIEMNINNDSNKKQICQITVPAPWRMTAAVFSVVPDAILQRAQAEEKKSKVMEYERGINLSLYNTTHMLQIAIVAYVQSGETGPIGVRRLSFAVFCLHMMSARNVNNIGMSGIICDRQGNRDQLVRNNQRKQLDQRADYVPRSQSDESVGYSPSEFLHHRNSIPEHIAVTGRVDAALLSDCHDLNETKTQF